jgi:hypothetical protein
LVFQLRVEVMAHRSLGQPQVVMSRGWWEEMSVNSVEPQPSSESTSNGAVVLSYDELQSAHRRAARLSNMEPST